jgi:hypothetical protein
MKVFRKQRKKNNDEKTEPTEVFTPPLNRKREVTSGFHLLGGIDSKKDIIAPEQTNGLVDKPSLPKTFNRNRSNSADWSLIVQERQRLQNKERKVSRTHKLEKTIDYSGEFLFFRIPPDILSFFTMEKIHIHLP